MITLTQWFNAAFPPSRLGNYDYRYNQSRFVFNAWWNGYAFVIADGSGLDGRKIVRNSNDAWRGLADKPEGGSE
jgi:hypothetical protein